MKVIFLDIDGVLNSKRYDNDRAAWTGNIDQTRMVLLKRLVDCTGAEIILSSSWRIHWDVGEAQCDQRGLEMNRIFGAYGLKIAGKTPRISFDRRADEIREWLRTNEGLVEQFVILDDIPYGWDELSSHVVKTNYLIGRGLEDAHVEAAVAILKTTMHD